LAYQIVGKDVVYDWLSHEPDPDKRHILLDWLVEVAQEPREKAYRVPGSEVPVYLAVVRVRPPITVKYLVADQFRAVKIIKIEPLS
jgi:hypothetical protein